MFKPTLHFFDFAHCRPMAEMAEVIATHENVFTDCSYMPPELMSRLGDFDWRERLLFGSDFPAYHARWRGRFTERYCQQELHWRRVGLDGEKAFKSYLRIRE